MTDRLSRAIPGHLDGLFFVPPAASFPAPNCNPAITSRRSSGGTRPEKFCRASLVHLLRYGGSILFSDRASGASPARRVVGDRDGLMVSSKSATASPTRRKCGIWPGMPTGSYVRSHASRQAATSGSTGQCCGGSTHSGGNSRKRVDPTCCDGWSGSGSKSRGVVRFPHARLLRDRGRSMSEGVPRPGGYLLDSSGRRAT